jgi:hypothetical protein
MKNDSHGGSMRKWLLANTIGPPGTLNVNGLQNKSFLGTADSTAAAHAANMTAN